MVYGPPGTGKSCAMAALYRSYWHPIEQVIPHWLRLEEFISQVIRCRTTRDGRVEVINPSGGPSFFRSEAQMFWIACNSPVLFLDDVGIKPASDTGREIAHKLFSQRDKTQPTFISSNLSPEELCDCYDSRIVSRICTGKVIHLHGADRRLEQTEFAELF
ncbi:hypothetical protein GYB59_14405 [bacterium]|nr:hypothetical protein [bacterium]